MSSAAIPSSIVHQLPHADGAAPPRPERRRRRRLRALCDEVLASFRVATGDDPLPPRERAEARRLLAMMVPHAPR